MLKIVGMSKDQLLGLHPDSLKRPGSIQLLTEKEVVYVAKVLGALWTYNYEAAKQSRPGLHAILKSGLHSDGFFYSKLLLEHINIRQIIACQIVILFDELGIIKPDWIVGIPDGATELGKEVATLLDVRYAEMKKVDGRIVLENPIATDETILLIEDFCTRGAGLTEAVIEILFKQPKAKIISYALYILNRGGLREIEIPAEKTGGEKMVIKVVPMVDYKINNWEATACPLCKYFGSEAIKPKATDENWRLITTSQQ